MTQIIKFHNLDITDLVCPERHTDRVVNSAVIMHTTSSGLH